jgi:hypothetical protein
MGVTMTSIGILFDIDELEGPFYGHSAYRILFGAVPPEWFFGCRLRDGDTQATLDGDARHYCISIESEDPGKIENIRAAVEKCGEAGLLPADSRFLENPGSEPLVVAGGIDAGGALVGCETDWVRAAWEEARKGG